MADAADLKSAKGFLLYGFDSRLRHQIQKMWRKRDSVCKVHLPLCKPTLGAKTRILKFFKIPPCALNTIYDILRTRLPLCG